MSQIPWKADVWQTGAKRTAEERRAIIMLRGTCTSSEVAKRFGMTRSAVCGVWFRARRKPS
ncbi:transposase [Ancylobacter sp. 3268]|uniref:hypothetical protein n=1 Tax=Ancylobacter sp. 3268 TaxID=2817752 RepID=UPI00285F4C98|nr:hypothetical protein [Ancylobacter sp. 3268]MDR6953810.1 transposase [Ancylobacter sp. 3268]